MEEFKAASDTQHATPYVEKWAADSRGARSDAIGIIGGVPGAQPVRASIARHANENLAECSRLFAESNYDRDRFMSRPEMAGKERLANAFLRIYREASTRRRIVARPQELVEF